MYINRLSVNDLGNIGYHLEDKYKSWIYLGKAYSVLPCMCLHSDSSPIHGKKKEKERGGERESEEGRERQRVRKIGRGRKMETEREGKDTMKRERRRGHRFCHCRVVARPDEEITPSQPPTPRGRSLWSHRFSQIIIILLKSLNHLEEMVNRIFMSLANNQYI